MAAALDLGEDDLPPLGGSSRPLRQRCAVTEKSLMSGSAARMAGPETPGAWLQDNPRDDGAILIVACTREDFDRLGPLGIEITALQVGSVVVVSLELAFHEVAGHEPFLILPTALCPYRNHGREMLAGWADMPVPRAQFVGVGSGHLLGVRDYPATTDWSEPVQEALTRTEARDVNLGEWRRAASYALDRLPPSFLPACENGAAQAPKVGRNAECVCGSGLKSKRCCG